MTTVIQAEVVQADREAAAAYVEANFSTQYPHLAEAVRDGNAYPELVKAFARHRLAHTPPAER